MEVGDSIRRDTRRGDAGGVRAGSASSLSAAGALPQHTRHLLRWRKRDDSPATDGRDHPAVWWWWHVRASISRACSQRPDLDAMLGIAVPIPNSSWTGWVRCEAIMLRRSRFVLHVQGSGVAR